MNTANIIKAIKEDSILETGDYKLIVCYLEEQGNLIEVARINDLSEDTALILKLVIALCTQKYIAMVRR